MLGTILLVILIALLVGALPRWGYHDLGYQPSGWVFALLVVVLILVATGRV